MERLALEKISVFNDRGAVVEDVSFSLQQSDILGLLGPNGSGKTSILRAIEGFIPARVSGKQPLYTRGSERRWMTGRVLIDAADVTTTPPGERRLGVVPQNLALFPNRTVLQNISFALWARGMRRREAEERAAALAKQLDITDVLDRTPEKTSGGQQQRTAIARAIIARPKVLLNDEAMASLDSPSRREILLLLKDVLHDSDAAAVVVTHDPAEAALLCTKVAFLNGGKLQCITTPEDAFTSPATLWIAQVFAGYVNQLTGTICDGRFHPDGCEGWFTYPVEGEPTSMRAVVATRTSGLVVGSDYLEGLGGLIDTLVVAEQRLCTRVKVATGVYLLVDGRLGQPGDYVRLVPNRSRHDDIRSFSTDGHVIIGKGVLHGSGRVI